MSASRKFSRGKRGLSSRSARGRAGCIALGLVLITLRPHASRADDWPQWRGPRRDGEWRETGILEKLPSGGLEVRWRAPSGVGFSSPVIARNRVFITGAELVRPQAREHVHAYDETSGSRLWNHTYDVSYPDWAFDEPNQLGPAATPVVGDAGIYALGRLGQLRCLRVGDGELIWKKDLEKEYSDGTGEGLQFCASPLLDGDRLIVFIGGKPGAAVIALDTSSGKELWKAVDESATHSSPIIVTAADTRQLIVWTQESVTSLDPATGNTYWRQRLITSADYVVSTPVVQENSLLIGGLMLELDRDKVGATVLWPEGRAVSRRVFSNTSTALLLGDYIYSATSRGQLVAIEARTGRQVWETDKVTHLKSGASIHLTRNGDSVLLFNDRGELIRARLAPDGYTELSRAPLIEPTYPFGGTNCAWAAPAYANRHVFVRNDKELICASLAATP
jgi:outer membrane protein assembly factor BamB